MNIEPVLTLLRTRTGMEAAPLGPGAVSRAIASRMRAVEEGDPARYAIRAGSDPAELAALVDEVVVPETWFFRGGELFYFLAEYVRSHALGPLARGTFRVLSLPCSTGEEPYSLALALAETGAAVPCGIDGIDLSPRNLDRARRAVYGELSFRQTPEVLRRRYFHPAPGGWRLDDSVRQAVRFRPGNLLDPQSLAAPASCDLVFCRNLFIYLAPEARAGGLTNLARLLKPGGLLCLGHAEPLDPADSRFERVGPPGYFLYRRSENPPHAAPPIRLPAAARRPGTLTAVAKEHTPAAPTLAAPLPAAPAPPLVPSERDALLAAARRRADLGEYGPAVAECSRLLDRLGPDADAYALLGAVHLAQHRPAEARRNLERALYLAPDHGEALLHLMLLFERQGEGDRAAALRARLRGGDQRSS